MAAVKNKNTTSEILIRKALFNKGFRYKINDKGLPGSPDIVLPKYNTVIFVHGCFWHGHTHCKKTIKPNSNVNFWKEKIEKNKKRDRKVKVQLKELGWTVIIVWECEFRNKITFNNKVGKIENLLRNK